MIDLLSDLLRVVRLDGAYFYTVEASEPWSVQAPATTGHSPRILPASEHLVPYHILVRGRCYAGLMDETPVEMRAGDVIVLPHGDAHRLTSAPDFAPGNDLAPPYPDDSPFSLHLGATGEVSATFICGFLGCDRRPFNPLLASLPRLMHMRGVADPWAGTLLPRLTEEARVGLAGAAGVLTRLAELMFIEVLRRYLEALPAGERGWLAGLRDELIARVLGMIHTDPAHAWTLAELAREAASSRSTLARRFTEVVGQPLMQYVARWRMQVAASRLLQSGATIAQVGAEVGYDSEAAFSRAFKKATGQSPGAWRELRRAART